MQQKMGVPEDIAETTIPLGTSFHKDGSIIGSVFKIMFLVCLFGTSLATTGDIMGVLGIALLANLLVTAVPIGGRNNFRNVNYNNDGIPSSSITNFNNDCYNY